MTHSKQDLYQKYQEKRSLYEKLKYSIIADLEAIFKRENLQINNIQGRVKDFTSFFQKLENLEKQNRFFEDPLIEMQDLVGVRATLLYVKDLEEIEELLAPTFKVVNLKRSGKEKLDDQFGYESDHYILTYGDVKGPHYEEFKDQLVELQVRTILMDAWDSVSHHLEYKNKESIPSELKKVFYGLSGMFVVADQVFQNLKESSVKSSDEQIEKIKTPQKLLNEEINLDTLRAYLEYKFQERFSSEAKLPKWVNDDTYSSLIKEIKQVGGYNKIKDLNEALDTVKDQVTELEKKEGGNKMLAWIIRMSLDLYDDKYFESRFGKMPKEETIDENAKDFFTELIRIKSKLKERKEREATT